jgi:orotidine-5'-phosphate decarboxylase
MGGIISRDKSVIPACDVVYLEELEELVSATHDVEGIGAYKIGFGLALSYGLPVVCESIREWTDLPIIYDHQKAATDTPHTGELFAKTCKDAGVDAVILFPQAGPETEKAWIKACKDERLGVIVGGEMTHPAYILSEGGWIDDLALAKIYTIARDMGVRDFVVPGNKPEKIKRYVSTLKDVDPIFYSPGLVAQGGEISESAKAAGERWHAIVGRGIYQAKDMNKAAKELTSELI